MAKKILSLALFLIIFSPSVANAQLTNTNTSSPTTNTRTPVRLQAPNSAVQSPAVDAMQQEQDGGAVQERMQQFRTQIQEIQDTRRRGIVQNIVEKIANANSRITQKMSSALDKLSRILQLVEEKAEGFSANGQNTTALLQAIVDAETAIDDAKNAVEEQASKQYTAEITDESTLRSVIAAMVSEFRTDISTVHDVVIAAKDAVMEAIIQARALQGSSNDATESANIN